MRPRSTNNHTKKLTGLAAAVLLLTVLVFALGGSGAAGSGGAQWQISEKAFIPAEEIGLKFSYPSGFYDEPFKLLLLCDRHDMTIHYTLDGSAPNENSPIFETALNIDDASFQPNRDSMRTDISAAFFEKEYSGALSEIVINQHFSAPVKPVDKCTVVRAVAIGDDGSRSEEISASYFVDFEEKAAYDGLSIASFICEPDDLFGFEKGIYVLGRNYQIYDRISAILGRSRDWQWWDANYRMQGREWERQAALHLFDPGRNIQVKQDVGIRIHGKISRGYLPHSLAVYAREEYGSPLIDADLWNTGYIPDKALLSGLSADKKAKECVINDLVRNTNTVCMNCQNTAVFINGEYWGNYSLTEKFDAAYLAANYDADKDRVMLVKDNEYVEGGKEALRAYKRMHSNISSADMTIDANYRKALETFDIDSFIDYFAIKIYVCDNDWPGKNYAVWRDNSGKGPYSDGKWRWMLFDLNHYTVLSTDYAEFDMVTHAIKHDSMFASLMQNVDFRDRFFARLNELSENELSAEAVRAGFNAYYTDMKTAAENENERFYGNYARQKDVTFLNTCTDAVQFCRLRAAYVDREYTDDWEPPVTAKGIKGIAVWDLETRAVLIVLGCFLIITAVFIIIDLMRNRRYGKKRA